MDYLGLSSTLSSLTGVDRAYSLCCWQPLSLCLSGPNWFPKHRQTHKGHYEAEGAWWYMHVAELRWMLSSGMTTPLTTQVENTSEGLHVISLRSIREVDNMKWVSRATNQMKMTFFVWWIVTKNMRAELNCYLGYSWLPLPILQIWIHSHTGVVFRSQTHPEAHKCWWWDGRELIQYHMHMVSFPGTSCFYNYSLDAAVYFDAEVVEGEQYSYSFEGLKEEIVFDLGLAIGITNLHLAVWRLCSEATKPRHLPLPVSWAESF